MRDLPGDAEKAKQKCIDGASNCGINTKIAYLKTHCPMNSFFCGGRNMGVKNARLLREHRAYSWHQKKMKSPLGSELINMEANKSHTLYNQ
jgi:hypothetical protein